jgi:hypothetical protein
MPKRMPELVQLANRLRGEGRGAADSPTAAATEVLPWEGPGLERIPKLSTTVGHISIISRDARRWISGSAPG